MHANPWSELGQRLREVGYDDPSCRRVLRLQSLLDIGPDCLPGLVGRCRDEGSPLAQLTAFWLLQEPLPLQRLESLLGDTVLQALVEQRLVTPQGEVVEARAGLYPFQGSYFFADPLGSSESPTGLPWLAPWGYALALCALRLPGEWAVDLGPGVQALLNASTYARSWGTCPSQEALATCRLNLLLNGLQDRCAFEETGTEDFDLITGRMAYFVPGSSQEPPGLAALAGRLREGGTLVLAEAHFEPGSDLLDRLQSWLGGPAGWGLGLMTYQSRPVGSFTPFLEVPLEERILDVVGAGCEQVHHGLLLLRRLPPGRPSWRAEARIKPPPSSMHDLVAQWLDAQEPPPQAGWQEGWAEWAPRWSFTGRLFQDARGGLGMARYQRGLFSGVTVLDQFDTFLLAEVDGHKSAPQLLESWSEHWQQSPEAARPEVARRLLDLRRKVLIW